MTAYSLAFGSLLLLGGRISDYIGRRNALIVGLVGFSGASAPGEPAAAGASMLSSVAVAGSIAPTDSSATRPRAKPKPGGPR